MKRTLIQIDRGTIPAQFHELISNSPVYDSSCSPEARVYFIAKEGGCYLKSAPRGTLQAEAQMSAYFHDHKIGPEVLSYFHDEKDWLLTRAVPGEDCLDPQYLAQPERLADTLADILHQLHSLDFEGCPVHNRIESYLATARRNYETNNYQIDLFPDNWGYASAEEAWKMIEENGHLLKNDTLIHGDYCLPNVMLDNWRFSSFIDVGNGGVGDKHIDLFWGAWSLGFNLKDDKYGSRFLDAYGRENFEPELLRLVAACEVFG